MYSGCDYLLSLKILFVCFLALPSLLHPSIFFNCFYTCNNNYVQSPNQQIAIRPRDEVIMTNDDETYDEMMMKPMMKLGENCFKMFSSHERVLGPRIRT